MTKTAPEQERETKGPRRTSGESFLAHPAHALWAGGVMLAIVVLIAILVPAGPLELDRSWSAAMHHLETPLLTHLALVFNWLGRGVGRAIALALVGLLLLRRRRWRSPSARSPSPRAWRRCSRRSSRCSSIARARPTDSSIPSVPPSLPATPPMQARPASRSSCSSPHPARAADGGGRSPASELSAWPGVARTYKSTGSRTPLPALFSAAASRSSCSPSHSSTYMQLGAPTCARERRPGRGRTKVARRRKSDKTRRPGDPRRMAPLRRNPHGSTPS